MIDSHAIILNVITDACTEIFGGKHRSGTPAGRVKIYLIKMRKRKNRRIRNASRARGRQPCRTRVRRKAAIKEHIANLEQNMYDASSVDSGGGQAHRVVDLPNRGHKELI